MKKPTIGLCMIVKDEAENIRKVLESAVDWVDTVYLTDTGSKDNTIKIAEEVCKRFKKPLHVSHFKWIDDFAAARNYNFSQAKTDWILWLDGDDTLMGGDTLGLAIANAVQLGVNAISMEYKYDVDKNEIDKATHPKVRLVRNGLYEWTPKAPIHENLFIKPGLESQDKQSYWKRSAVRHWAEHADFIASGKRNLRILRKLEKKERSAGILDHRTVFLLGREYHSVWKLTGEKKDRNNAEDYLARYISLEKVGGERMTACSLLFDIKTTNGSYDEALQIAFEAIKSHPSHPLGYILVGKAYSFKGDYPQVVNWVNQAIKKDMDELDGTVNTPKGLMREAALLLAEAYMETEEFELSLNALYKYKAIAEDYEKAAMMERIEVVKSRQLGQKIMKAFTVLGNLVIQDDMLEEAQHLLNIVPSIIHNKKEVVAFKRRLGLNTEWPEGNIVIFCGGGFEPWDESSLATGIGGSETAVVEMSKRFGEAGYKVTVFNSVEDVKTFGNVTYRPWDQCNFEDKFDIFISWRNPILASKFNVHADHKYLWLHDVPSPADYTQEVIDSYDKIIVLSEFHRSLLPAVPDEKFYISSNGINVDMIREIEAEGIIRDPKRIIYASSPDRGLENLLDVLEEIKEERGEIPPTVWPYGWITFDALRKDKPSLEWKARMQKRMKDLGVQELGRLGKKDLLREFFKSGIWAYPTNFEEINCITAQDAQACGCWPVTTGYAALAEMQRVGSFAGSPFDKKAFKRHLLTAIDGDRGVFSEDDQEYGDEVESLRSQFSWDKTATEWMNDLFYGGEYEHVDPLVSIVCNTIRPGVFRILRETIEAQTYKNLELIVVDGRYEERKDEVAEYMKDFKYPFLHLPDPERDTTKYPYGLYHADNAALSAVRGDLVVFLQDFIIMPEDGVQKFVDLYKVHPDKIYTGVDTRNKSERGGTVIMADALPRTIDIFQGQDYEVKEEEFKSPRIRVGKAKRLSNNPFEWELNYAAAPTHIMKEMGGWDQDWDKAFGYDNTVFALRFLYEGGLLIVDETNQATALSHWQIFGDDDKEGVPHRSKKTNDNRYANYYRYLQQREGVSGKIKAQEVKYPKDILIKIQEWKEKIKQ